MAMIPLHACACPPACERRLAAVLQSGYVADGAHVARVRGGARRVDRQPSSRHRGRLLQRHRARAGRFRASGRATRSSPPRTRAWAPTCRCSTLRAARVVRPGPGDGQHRPARRSEARDDRPRPRRSSSPTGAATSADIDATARGRPASTACASWRTRARRSAPAHGGRRVGAHGTDACVLSFGPVRHLTRGEGAALALADPARAERLRWRSATASTSRASATR